MNNRVEWYVVGDLDQAGIAKKKKKETENDYYERGLLQPCVMHSDSAFPIRESSAALSRTNNLETRCSPHVFVHS